MTAELSCCTFRPSSFPRDRLPEIAFAGRSNVGKSSLINDLLGYRNLARTSSDPGKTIGINFYKVNRSFYFVDLPGYGYSKVPDALRERWKHLVTGYLSRRSELVLTLLLIDSRRPPQESDLQMWHWMKSLHKDCAVVLTKADKIGNARNTIVARVARALETEAVFAASMKSNWGREKLLEHIFQVIQSSRDR